ncbi:Ca2+-dependent phosphoinositide-specific phospholipase C [uncultured Tenacibaculum sp.]|uniref:Ca2+-dependent phosphoinositide-specific phospholipase C n=1 Tax=uncultured Tenacibaculum sp. TaxID=174713 RepID=UPI002634C2E8|nr:Ca2+-dependent phosphoinositide-specific phospholipase C [uncultured Tenacibaculum sp.]
MKKILFLSILTLFTLISCSESDNCYECESSITNEIESSDIETTKNRAVNLDQLKYNQVMYKGSHNSYERREDITEQITNSSPAYQNNVLALELDIWRNTPRNSYTNTSIPSNTWVVNHWPHPGRYGRTLASYFSKLKDWHNRNRNHLPIMIKLDVKSSNGGYQNFHEQIEWYLQRFLGDSDVIFKAQRLFKDPNRSIRHNVLYENAWPSMNELRGKFIIVLTGNGSWMDQYVRTNSRYRWAFGMKAQTIANTDNTSSGISQANNTIDNTPNYVFYNFSMSDINDKRNKAGSREYARQLARRGMITRVYSANNRDEWERCKSWKISCISTNKIKNHDWAKIDNNNMFIQR